MVQQQLGAQAKQATARACACACAHARARANACARACANACARARACVCARARARASPGSLAVWLPSHLATRRCTSSASSLMNSMPHRDTVAGDANSRLQLHRVRI